MNYRQLQEVTELVQEIPDAGKRDRLIAIILSAAGDIQKKQEKVGRSLKFNKKEISRMPESLSQAIFLDSDAVKIRERKSGPNINYEVRYRRNGYNIAVSSNDLKKAKAKFMAAVEKAEKEPPPKKPLARTYYGKDNFDTFSQYYFETYRKRKVTEGTMRRDLYRYKHHLLPEFGAMRLRDITPQQCQEFFDRLAQKDMTKTCNELHSLLNGIFKMAIAHGYMNTNPLAIVLIEKHECEHGHSLTKAEEKRLLEALKGTRYERLFALALYTGLRPNEFYTVQIRGDFVVSVNSKRKTRKVEYKRIPILPMLRPYVDESPEFEFPSVQVMRKQINRILPHHKLYDLRTTFYTRCEECGVAEAARNEFVGHSGGVLNNAYTDLSDEYLLKEGAKLVW